jgi:peptidoglycan hydrolase-like protein with peptidoglycan-binding domain
VATIAGGQLRTPRGTLAWQPVAAVAKAYQFATASGKDSYKCLGVVGNWAHLNASSPGDHTPYSSHITVVGGKRYVPKRGWVYAIDLLVPEPAKFERWLLGRLRAGYYKSVKYWNISGRHWNRRIVVGGKPFGKSSRSGDHHLHLSFMPGSEYTAVDILGDYEHYRTTGKNRTVAVPSQRPAPVLESAPAKPAARPVDTAARKLPAIRKGATGRYVKLLQALLVAREFWPRSDESARRQIDGQFGKGTEDKVKAFQRQAKLTANGVVDAATWAALTPDQPSTVIRGSSGFYAWLMQCLLWARNFNPGPIDGAAGDKTIAALKRFQVDRKVKGSVVKGRGDGVGGTNSWVALVTF